MPSWDSAAADDLWTETCGKDCLLGNKETLDHDIRRVSDAKLWQFRTAASKSLIEYARERLSQQLAASGVSSEMVEEAKAFVRSKHTDSGLCPPLCSLQEAEPVAARSGETAPPTEQPQAACGNSFLPVKPIRRIRRGQALIREWIHFIRRSEVRPHVIFLSDYDMLLTEHLVQGVDVWINTPRRPWEACGTSGMKVLVNGGINLSELDGWWAEAYTPEVGWALGMARNMVTIPLGTTSKPTRSTTCSSRR